jgi:gas vesicle protein
MFTTGLIIGAIAGFFVGALVGANNRDIVKADAQALKDAAEKKVSP